MTSVKLVIQRDKATFPDGRHPFLAHAVYTSPPASEDSQHMFDDGGLVGWIVSSIQLYGITKIEFGFDPSDADIGRLVEHAIKQAQR
jgi:hypothetical protein